MGVYIYTEEQEWKPGANTLAYYPLTSITTTSDLSGNNRTLTNGGATFGTYAGVDCAYLPGDKLLYNTSQYGLSGPFTISIWAYYVWYSPYSQNPRFYGNDSGNIGIRILGDTKLIGYNPKGGETTTTVTEDSWVNYIVTYDGTNCKLYINSTNVDTTAKSGYTYTDQYLGIGRYYPNGGNYWKGGLSEFIMENKVRTATDISDYYNLTKSNYGL